MPTQPHDTGILTIERLRLSAAIRAPLTILAYSTDWRHFSAWCSGRGVAPLPVSADDIAFYAVAELNRGCKITTVARRVNSIAYAHRNAGFPSPAAGGEIARLLLGAKRIRQEQPLQKAPVSVADLRRICQAPCVGVTATRNRAILLFGFGTALRRSNIAALDLQDLRFTPLGVVVRVRKEKTDQTGIGRNLAVTIGEHETCPVKALQAWLEFRRDEEGPLFQRILNGKLMGRMHPNRISLVVKAQMESLGKNPAHFGAHSMRSGHVTESVANGVHHLVIMHQTGHKSFASLEKYFRECDPFRSNSCAALGL